MNTLLLSLLLSSALFCQGKNEELVSWSNQYKLTWADYKGKADPASDAAASTATYLVIDYNLDAKGLTYKIACRFSKTKSWVRHKTDHILAHEQGHFDIAEIFARKLNKRMQEYRFDKKHFRTDLKKIYDETMTEKEKMQNNYDKETNHSINKEKQAEWQLKIQTLLETYTDYSDY